MRRLPLINPYIPQSVKDEDWGGPGSRYPTEGPVTRELAGRYVGLLEGCSGIGFPRTTEGGSHSCQSFCIFVENRDEVMKTLRAGGVEVQIGLYALQAQPAFRVEGAPDGSRYAFDHCMVPPLYHEMTEDDQEYVVEKLSALVQPRSFSPRPVDTPHGGG